MFAEEETQTRRSKFEDKNGILILDDYHEAATVLSDKAFRVPDLPGFLRKLEAHAPVDLRFLKLYVDNSPFFLEGPKHKQLRDVCLRHLSGQALKEMDDVIVTQTGLILDNLPNTSFDVIALVGKPIFTRIIKPLLGLAPLESEKFDRLAMVLQRLIEPMLSLNNLARINNELEWLTQQIQRQLEMGPPAGGMLAELMADKDTPLSDEEKVALVITLYAAVAPLAQTLCNIIEVLYRDGPPPSSEPLQMLESLPYIIHQCAAPRFIHRVAAQPRKLGSITIRQGDTVMIDITKAALTEIDVPGGRLRHYSFGHGAHFCIGAPLSKRIINEFIPRFLKQFPRLQVLNKQYDESNHIARALTSLTVSPDQ
ncbi:cytochrome P450 [Hahella aquimaris]|uniref:cytochrome P450 n=1 Tax=Hahella sp. HNIBRBA332 TaxID=3015983 RepID=UPI00273AF61E|nr:cytochrome P450 [Hahella sp. HNIBRBA332]WLQ16133.1 cytochrome P450 [Hahella sp. HNIBRBA332]